MSLRDGSRSGRGFLISFFLRWYDTIFHPLCCITGYFSFDLGTKRGHLLNAHDRDIRFTVVYVNNLPPLPQDSFPPVSRLMNIKSSSSSRLLPFFKFSLRTVTTVIDLALIMTKELADSIGSRKILPLICGLDIRSFQPAQVPFSMRT